MWKQIIFPTSLVVVLWLTANGLTTKYMSWLDHSYQSVLRENVASISAAGALRQALWRAQAYVNTNGHATYPLGAQFAHSLRVVEDEFVRLESAATIEGEAAIVSRLRQQFADYRASLENLASERAAGNTSSVEKISQDLIDRAESMDATSSDLQNLNERALERAEQMRERWRYLVLSMRTVLLIAGPTLGLLLGWRISRRLHKSMSQVNITLRDAAAELEHDLGTLEIRAEGDLQELQQRVALVIKRLEQVTSELHNSRQEVLRSERLAAVGGLAAGVAHELRNPLTSIKLLLQHAARKNVPDHLGKRELQVIIEEVLRMERTIQGLLDFSRAPRLRRQDHDLRDTLQRALNLLEGQSKKQNVELLVSLGNKPLWVYGDPEQLHQVFVNLLLNGIESMAHGGVLEIRANLNQSLDRIVIEFRDHGQGIAEEVVSRLFEPFVSAKDRGTGLGLAVCRRIVTQHNGTISAANVGSGGARFIIELPAKARSYLGASSEHSGPAAKGIEMSVLQTENN